MNNLCLILIISTILCTEGLALKMKAGYILPGDFRAIETIQGISSVASCSIICKQKELNGYPCWAIQYNGDTESCDWGHAKDIKAEPDVGLIEIYYNPDQSGKIAVAFGGSPGFEAVYENGALCTSHGLPTEYKAQDFAIGHTRHVTFTNHKDEVLYFFKMAFVMPNNTYIHVGDSFKLDLLEDPPHAWTPIAPTPDDTYTFISSSPRPYNGKIFLTGAVIHSYDINTDSYTFLTSYGEPGSCTSSNRHKLLMWNNYLFIIGSYHNIATQSDCQMVFDMDQPSQPPKKIPTIPTWYEHMVTCDITRMHQENAHYILCAGGRSKTDSVKMLKLVQDENGNWPEWQEYESRLPYGVQIGLLLNYGTSLKLASLRPDVGLPNGDVTVWDEDTRTFVLDASMTLPELINRNQASVQMIPLASLKGC